MGITDQNIINESPSETLSTLDPDVIQYLDTLDRIYQLTLETNRISKSSFIHLSKANYLAGNIGSSKAFGKEQYDNRDRTSSLVTDETLKLQDKLSIDKTSVLKDIKKKIIEAELNTKKSSSHPTTESKAENADSDSGNDFKLFNDDMQQIKNRKPQQASATQGSGSMERTDPEIIIEESNADDIDLLAEQKFKEIKREISNKDPIKMFKGGMVPKDLRVCQSKSKELISLAIQLHNAKQDLSKLAKQINDECDLIA